MKIHPQQVQGMSKQNVKTQERKTKTINQNNSNEIENLMLK